MTRTEKVTLSKVLPVTWKARRGVRGGEAVIGFATASPPRREGWEIQPAGSGEGGIRTLGDLATTPVFESWEMLRREEVGEKPRSFPGFSGIEQVTTGLEGRPDRGLL
jgi:hypothetical protein